MRATYRLQLGPGLGFAEVEALVPYLAELGVSHLYLSPSFQARAGSTHGYDVIDPTRISAALGGEDGLRALAAAARGAGLGIVLDVVPNHMATDDANRFWADPELRAKFFDLDPERPGFHRRFFDIDDLAGVRVEDPEVFETTHALVLGLVGDGMIDGLRVDHPDGLADPLTYVRRLRERGVPHVWVEKIVDPEERLAPAWAVDGTTGYEFLNDAIALFVDDREEERFTALYAELTGDARPFAEIAGEAKLEQARTTFAREVEWLRRLWPGAPAELEEALSSLPVYRTYLPELDDDGGLPWLRGAPPEFVARFQQTTPPIMAKGVEDTAFYRYGRLLALNDVGGDPSRFGISAERFHEANALRAAEWPTAMVTLQTHDTKRSADVRARLAALTWIGDSWEALARELVPTAPDPGEGWLFLQTAVAAPLAPERLRGYVEKALRERKLTSSWAEPDLAHERATADWTVGLLEREEVRAFADALAIVAEPIVLGQKLLALTVPGVPDVYQGDEDGFLALVDPDNRRPVDWGALRTPTPSPKLALTRAALAIDLVGLPYEPVDAGPGAVAFRRGDAAWIAAATRPGAVVPAAPAGYREAFAAPGVALHTPT